MFCVIVNEDIVSNFEAERFDKLAFLWFRPSLFLSFLGFGAIVIENLLGSCSCNFSLSENHLQPRGRQCASFRLSTIF